MYLDLDRTTLYIPIPIGPIPSAIRESLMRETDMFPGHAVNAFLLLTVLANMSFSRTFRDCQFRTSIIVPQRTSNMRPASDSPSAEPCWSALPLAKFVYAFDILDCPLTVRPWQISATTLYIAFV